MPPCRLAALLPCRECLAAKAGIECVWLTITSIEMTIKSVPVFEAKTRLSELLAAVEQGEQVTITRRGVPVARLVPAAAARRGSSSQRQRVAQTFARLRAQRAGVTLDVALTDAISEGRD